jgi:hypothetical protein
MLSHQNWEVKGNQEQSTEKMLQHITAMTYSQLCATNEFIRGERYLRIFGAYAALNSKQQSRHSQNGKRLGKIFGSLSTAQVWVADYLPK